MIRSKTPSLRTKTTISDRTASSIRAVLDGEKRGLRSVLLFAGPAVIASIAYIDPGNVATNIQAGAGYGYHLLWVVVLANAIALMFQAMSAKIGIVTNRNLAELCRDHFPFPLAFGMWIVSEIAAMATDLAEFLGGAIGFALLLHMPLLVGMGATALLTYAILLTDRIGFRPIELIIGVFALLVVGCYALELLIAPIDWHAVAFHSVVPSLPNGGAVTLAVGIIGATVMPHAIYLHSALPLERFRATNDAEKRLLVRFSNRETWVALSLAGLVNMAMVAVAASVFHFGHSDIAQIETAYATLIPLLGMKAAGIFLLSLMASGISSSVVGTLAGQQIMQGFLGQRIPVWLRRLLTMIPAFAVVAIGFNPTQCLVISQVILSMTLPVPMLALLVLSQRRALMGPFATSRLLGIAASTGAAIVLCLNVILIWQTFAA